MSWQSWFERTRVTLAGLTAGAQTRANAEANWAETNRTEVDTAERELAKSRRLLDTRAKDENSKLDADHRTRMAAMDGTAEAGRASAAATRAEETRRLFEKVAATEKEAQEKYQDKRWTLDSMLEAGEKEASDLLLKDNRTVASARATLRDAWDALAPLLKRVRLNQNELIFPVTALPSATVTTDVEGKLEVALEDVASSLDKATKPVALALCSPAGSALLAVVAAIVCGGIGFAIAETTGLAVGAGVGLIVGGAVLHVLVRWLVRMQVRDRARAFGVYHAEATRATETFETYTRKTHDETVKDLRAKHVQEHQRADEKYLPFFEQLKAQRGEHQATIETQYGNETKRLLGLYIGKLRDEEVRHANATQASESALAKDREAAETLFKSRMAKATLDRDNAYKASHSHWHTLVESTRKELTELKALGEAAYPPYAELKELPTMVPGGVRMGEWLVDLAAIPQGISADATMNPTEPLAFNLPAMIPFPDRSAVLLKAKDDARSESIRLLQAMMLRFLTGLPPGKVRFTIIDPVGLGENFASFMHLADHDEQLVTGRIWTEPDHIEQRLTDLTEHMETVIQKYLRNQYKSIEVYNREAGEVAEPYRVLVIANFPTNFTPDAAKRLISIVNSGPSCGVCTLVAIDTRASLPRDFRMVDLELPSLNFVWNNSRFELKHPDLAMFPLTLDGPPNGPVLVDLVRRVGAASRDAARVEVPFDFIAPKPDAIWSLSASKGIDVPIGRAGATRRQHFRLGSGTAQHALVAGKTGSGKSTFLHALITNLALHYSPGEIDLYLIDFKKGVEFKSYASHGLPHARVVAIESEREFGLSVLQKLDTELKERGDKFRDVGTNDLAGYRESLKKKAPQATLPRIMLIIDEFQEFFVEDDKLAQEAALLLDRLVRQGRAFGMHVLLGSQTLGGAYSLARSTIDQMAVRIALQCSDADAQLILSKDNSAARLLSRPGEAIYNDANGLVEGNDPFQVVWLDEAQRERDIEMLRDRAKGMTITPPLIFEGNASADLTKNLALTKLYAHRPTVLTKAPIAWLGDPVAITAATNATFRVQSASNLLIIGQHEESALAQIAAVAVSLSAQVPLDTLEPVVNIIDGTQDDSESADYLRKLTVTVGPAAKVIERHEIAPTVAMLAGIVETRTRETNAERAARFLVVHGLQRFRELRKPEEDFGFRKGEKTISPGEHFATILRDGPAVGVHVIVWVDTLTNLTRAFDRQAVKEFGHKVLFAMSPNDSSLLLDTPAAAKLGRNRALYTRDDLEKPEKFRPYGLPGLDWLRQVCGAASPATTSATVQETAATGVGLPT